MRRRKEDAEATKQSILRAALEVFSRSGYAATRVEDIAEQANVTTGAIYHHFSGKSDVYIKLVEATSARVNQQAQEILSEGGTPEAKLRRLLVGLFEQAEEDREYRALLELSLKTEQTAELATIVEQTLESRRMLTQFFAELIEAGIAAGEFKPGVPPEDAALALVGFMNGVGLLWVQDPGLFSIKARAAGLVDVALGGIVAD